MGIFIPGISRWVFQANSRSHLKGGKCLGSVCQIPCGEEEDHLNIHTNLFLLRLSPPAKNLLIFLLLTLSFASYKGNDQRLYEFIVRHFLACCSEDAKGQETTVEIEISNERFVAHGLMVLARNYLEVYPYERWSDKVGVSAR